MDIKLLDTGNRLRREIEQLQCAFPPEEKYSIIAKGYGAYNGIDIKYQCGNGGKPKIVEIRIPPDYADNILGLIESRINQLIKIKQQEFAELK